MGSKVKHSGLWVVTENSWRLTPCSLPWRRAIYFHVANSRAVMTANFFPLKILIPFCETDKCWHSGVVDWKLASAPAFTTSTSALRMGHRHFQLPPPGGCNPTELTVGSCGQWPLLHPPGRTLTECPWSLQSSGSPSHSSQTGAGIPSTG